MLNVQNVSYQLGDKHILNNVNLQIADGECTALLGPNGAGKSSLIDVITGAINPQEGTVRIWDKSFENVKKDVGVVYEYPPLFQYLTVKEILFYICEIYDVKYSSIKEHLAILDVQKLENKLAKVLSKGEKKKVGILLSLIHNPKFIILDEPTSDLDPFIRDICWRLFKTDSRTILFTTHLWEEAEKNADKIAFIYEGQIKVVDTPLNLLSSKYLLSEKKIIFLKEPKLMQYLNGHIYFEEDNQYHVFTPDVSSLLNKVKDITTNYSIVPKELKDVYLYVTSRESYV